MPSALPSLIPPGQQDYQDDDEQTDNYWDNAYDVDNDDMYDVSLTSNEASDAALAVAVKLDSS